MLEPLSSWVTRHRLLRDPDLDPPPSPNSSHLTPPRSHPPTSPISRLHRRPSRRHAPHDARQAPRRPLPTKVSVWRGARLSCNYIGRHLDSLTLPTSDRRSQRPPPGTIAYPPALQGRHWGQGRWPAVGWPARCASRSRSAPGVRLRSDFG